MTSASQSSTSVPASFAVKQFEFLQGEAENAESKVADEKAVVCELCGKKPSKAISLFHSCLEHTGKLTAKTAKCLRQI